jgi:hypothetical protein
MLRLLLDEHIYPGLTKLVNKLDPGLPIETIHTWQGGMLLNESDERILKVAALKHMTLVTFDVTTIPPLLATMAESGENHGGIIFVSSKSFTQNDFNGMAHALIDVYKNLGKTDWVNRVLFLTKKQQS